MSDSNEAGKLQRKLTLRHLYRIAIGGGIGTGILLASGAAISMAGPGGAIIAYLLIAALVYFIMMSLAEMSAFMPVTGAYEAQGTRFIDPAIGFALGWNYWISWAVTIAVELSAGAILMKYWFPEVPGVVCSGILLIIIFSINIWSVKAYGEAEYWFASIKISTIIILIVIGLLMILGIINRGVHGFSNYTIEEAPFVGGPLGIFSVVLFAGYAMMGVEMVAVTAGEIENPEKTLPKVIKNTIWLILLFYIITITVIGAIIPYTDPSLLNSGVEKAAASPFTTIFRISGIPFAGDIMNAIALVAVLSTTNSGMYQCSRTLYGLSLSKKAHRMFSRVNRRGVPYVALIATALIGALCFLSSIFGEGVIYFWLLNASALSGFVVWMFIAICHFQFRRGLILQGYDITKLPFKAGLFPLGPIFSITMCLIIMVIQVFLLAKISIYGILVSYISIFVFAFLYFGYKIKYKTKAIPLNQIDYSIGKFETKS